MLYKEAYMSFADTHYPQLLGLVLSISLAIYSLPLSCTLLTVGRIASVKDSVAIAGGPYVVAVYIMRFINLLLELAYFHLVWNRSHGVA